MKKHDSGYEGLGFKISVTNNGFLVTNMNFTVTGWTAKHFSNFDELVNELASDFGLTKSGERVTIVTSQEY
jgi:hypothetical protein